MDNIRYKEAFLLMDENNSGVITVDDVRFLIRALGYTPTENDLETINIEFINNKNIDYLWFSDIMSKISCTKYSYEQIENAFFAFDKNRYGKQLNNRKIVRQIICRSY
jgi:Ca2+-binding EF-hand superfamily protein